MQKKSQKEWDSRKAQIKLSQKVSSLAQKPSTIQAMWIKKRVFVKKKKKTDIVIHYYNSLSTPHSWYIQSNV